MTTRFADLGLRWKLLTGFAVVVALLGVVSYVGVSSAQMLNSRVVQADETLLPSSLALARTQAAAFRAQRDLRSAILSDSQKDVDDYLAKVKGYFPEAEKAWSVYAALSKSEEEKRLAPAFEQAYKGVKDAILQAAPEAAKNSPEGKKAATETILKAAPQATAMNNALQSLMDLQDQQATRAGQEAAADYERTVKLLVGVAIVAVVFAMGVALFLSQTIVKAVKGVSEAARRIAQEGLPAFVAGAKALAAGDLTQDVAVSFDRVPVGGRDEIGHLAVDFNHLVDGLQQTGDAFAEMTANLRELVGSVQTSAVQLAESATALGTDSGQTGVAAHQVAAGVQSVSEGFETTRNGAATTTEAVGQLNQAIDGIARGAADQASQVQQASGTATQMASGVEQVAQNANQVAAASQQTRAAAEHGVQAVEETVASMQEIKSVVGQAAETVAELGQLGEQIGAVVNTIDDIAEQTNLLALNAAIEAARAGEHGKGFAVVAEEVRKLAERSGRETKQIADLIKRVQDGTQAAVRAMTNGSEKVEQGSDKADQAGRALREILQAVQATVEQVSSIAASAQQMSAGARQVTEAMQSISAVVEENTAATEEMAAQAGQVRTAVADIARTAENQSAAIEEISAGAEEMSGQVEGMGGQVQELAAMAEQLKGLVVRFTLDQNHVATVPFPQTGREPDDRRLRRVA